MYKITDISMLGTDYTVSDPSGKSLGTIQVIPFAEILNATLGPYTADIGSYSTYLEKCVALLTGFQEINQYDVLWYATSEPEVALSEIIEYAVKHGYTTVILEHLEELE